MSDNPLLRPSDLPNKVPPFDKIETGHFKPAVEAAINEARANIQTIKTNKDPADFENTIVALETASESLGYVCAVFYNQLSAAGNDEMQELAGEIGPMNANFSSDVLLDEDLFARIREVYDSKDGLDLTAEQATLLEDTYQSFVRGGAELPENKKQRLREINEAMSTLGPIFMNNVKKSAEAFELLITDEADLDGLPESAVEGAKYAAQDQGHDGKWLFTLDIPSFLPFMMYSTRRPLREEIWRAFTSRGYGDAYDNTDAILKIINLRHERAGLLGYDTHADFVLERRMAESRDTVWQFIETLKNAYKPAAEQDLADIRALAREEDGLEDIQPWDVAFYSEKLKQKRFDFSSEDLRPYFPLEQVLKGTFDHFSELFDIRFEANTDYPVWHRDVTAYDVYDKTNDRFMGTLYADFYPRTGKKDGAWKTSYRDQGLFNGKVERPVVAIVCNFTKPAGETPSLLTHNEVSTLFHEMGHAMHALLSDVTYPSVAGTNVKWDFVELPSQVQENWTFEKETLDRFARHYKTGETIPQDLLDKLNAARNFMVGWGGLRQINFATLDMAWHTTDPASIDDVAAFEDKATAGTSLFPRLSGPFSTGFNHIFAGGYAAGYYSYKWAEVLDADTFELFAQNGLYDSDTASRYRHEVLARGGSEHPKTIYRRFRGRDADEGALLRREGLDRTDKAA